MISEKDWQHERARNKRVRYALYAIAAVPLIAVLCSTLWLLAYWWSH